MPVVNVPLVKFEELKIKRPEGIAAMILRRIRLYVDGKKIEKELKGDAKSGVVGLNSRLFSELRFAIKKSEVKSFEFVDYYGMVGDEDGRYQVSMIVYDKGQSKLQLPLLLSTPFDVHGKCKCGKKVTIETTVPPSLIKECTKEGKVPEPTISVKQIGGGGDVNGDEDE